jgi:hypothetical protein
VVITAVCALHGHADGDGDGLADGLALRDAGLDGDRLGDRPRVGEVDGDGERDADTLGDALLEQMAPPGQPQIVTPGPASGAPPAPSLTADAIRSVKGGEPGAALTCRAPPPVSASSAKVKFADKISALLALVLLTALPSTRKLRARVPQSTYTVPGPASPAFKKTRLALVRQRPPKPPAARAASSQSAQLSDANECAPQSTAMRPPPPPGPGGRLLNETPPAPPDAVSVPVEKPSVGAESRMEPPEPPPPPSKHAVTPGAACDPPMLIVPLTTRTSVAMSCSAAPPAPAGWHTAPYHWPRTPPEPSVLGASASPYTDTLLSEGQFSPRLLVGGQPP